MYFKIYVCFNFIFLSGTYNDVEYAICKPQAYLYIN